MTDTPDERLLAMLTGAPTIAVVGASPKPGRASRDIVGYLVQHGYRVIPINPVYAGQMIFGQPVVARLADVAEPIDIVDIFRRTEALAGVVDEALALSPKPKVIGMQLGQRDEAAARRAEAAGLTVVMDRCIKIEHGRLGL